MFNQNALKPIHDMFPISEMPFMHQCREYLGDTRPYQGMRILHNVPLTLTTLLKVELLAMAGAELVNTPTRDMKADPRVITLLREANLNFCAVDEVKGSFDFVLDCCADMLNKVDVKRGAVELTRTGSVVYEKTKTTYPVISADSSKLKNLETLLGTGDGFVRSFQQLTQQTLTNKHFVIFGFGKVGRGIAKAILEHSSQLTIIEPSTELLALAASKDLNAIRLSDKSAVEQALKTADCIITATGIKNVISDSFSDISAFKNKFMANMGAEDEFGPKFASNEVLFDKHALNFCLDEPTKLRYLDPIFYAHNCAIDYFISGEIKSGFHVFPHAKDQQILQEWVKYHGEDVSWIV